jgi:Domain of unknown function (DUF4902)
LTLILESHDFYYRLSLNELSTLEWTHDFSVVDKTHENGNRSGATEWRANTLGMVLSLGWDWIDINPKTLEVDAESGVRTNILIVDKNGYDFTVAASESCLLFLISKLDWQRYMHA